MSTGNARAFMIALSMLAHSAVFATVVTYKFTGEITGTPIGAYSSYTAGTQVVGTFTINLDVATSTFGIIGNQANPSEWNATANSGSFEQSRPTDVVFTSEVQIGGSTVYASYPLSSYDNGSYVSGTNGTFTTLNSISGREHPTDTYSQSQIFLYPSPTGEYAYLIDGQPVFQGSGSGYFETLTETGLSSLDYNITSITAVPLPAKYAVTVLSTLPGGTYTLVTAMNDVGQVIGTADDHYDLGQEISAAIWTGTTPTIMAHGKDVLTLEPTGINDAGMVVGVLGQGKYFPWAWNGTNLDYFPGGNFGIAEGINDSGEVVGWTSHSPTSSSRATFWSSVTSSSLTILPSLAEPAIRDSYALSVNKTGQIVGFSGIGANGGRATLWTGTQALDLGTLGGSSSRANHINDNGWIVGWAETGGGAQHASLWGEHTTAFDLGTLGGKSSFATGINQQGDIAGSAQTVSGAWHAVLWTHKHFKPIDLNIEISEKDAREVTLTDAVATNDHCVIAVNGYSKTTGAPASYVLSLQDKTICNE